MTTPAHRPSPVSPTQTVASLTDVARGLRRAGASVELNIEVAQPLPSAVDTTTFEAGAAAGGWRVHARILLPEGISSPNGFPAAPSVLTAAPPETTRSNPAPSMSAASTTVVR